MSRDLAVGSYPTYAVINNRKKKTWPHPPQLYILLNTWILNTESILDLAASSSDSDVEM